MDKEKTDFPIRNVDWIDIVHPISTIVKNRQNEDACAKTVASI